MLSSKRKAIFATVFRWFRDIFLCEIYPSRLVASCTNLFLAPGETLFAATSK
ncbi:hypothetical protein HMPREF1870_00558 [Bacteroidales bacterium KA00344]|nr:hypothetical protein HMPREF1870_00558 [Bacteroidales bacterium KA00344]